VELLEPVGERPVDLRRFERPRDTTASASSDAGGSGLAGYEHHVSLDGGLTWGATQSGASVTFTTTGTYRVQFRSRDNAGNASAWTPAAVGATNTACIL
jgi:hypothetical protein